MVISLIREIRNKVGNAEFIIAPIYSHIDIDLCNEQGIQIVGRIKPLRNFLLFPWTALVLLRVLLWRFFNRVLGINVRFLLNRTLGSYYDSDIVIDLGGDTFTDVPNMVYLISHFCSLLPAITFGKPIVVCAQTVGPFKKRASRMLARYMLNKMKLVIVRDPISKETIFDLDVMKPVYLTNDLAFLEYGRTSEGNIENVFSKETAMKLHKPIIGINPSSIIYHWMFPETSSDKEKYDQYIKLMANLIQHLTNNYNASVILIPHVTGPSYACAGPFRVPDDRVTNRRIMDNVKDKGCVYALEGDYSPEALTEVIGRCELFIGCRLHATVNAFVSGVPFLLLGYGQKSAIMEELLGGRLVVDVRNKSSDELFAELVSSLRYLFSNKDEISEFLKRKNPEINRISMNTIELVVNLMGDSSRYKTVEDIRSQGLCACTGTCAGVCPENAIDMRLTRGGVYVPYIEFRKCNFCGSCIEVCPGHSVDFGSLNKFVFNKLPEDDLIGNYMKCYVGHSTNEDIRKGASSGGAITALLIHALEQGAIDGALVTRTDRSLEPEFVIAKTKDEIIAASGSKYCPAPINIKIREVIGNCERIAYVGLPCQLHGMRKVEQLNDDLRKRVVLHLGLFCGHAVSFQGTELLLKKIGVNIEEVEGISYRGCGWPGRMTVKSKEGERTIHYTEYWPSLFGSFFFTPTRCTLCCDQMAELADISFGDPWLLEFKNESLGKSIIVVRNEEGEKIIRDAQINGDIEITEITREKLIQSQFGSLYFKKVSLGSRAAYLKHRGKRIPDYISTTERSILKCASSIPLYMNIYISQNPYLRNILRYAPFSVLRAYNRIIGLAKKQIKLQ